MSDWKELEIGNLPSDILVGDYEFEFWNEDEWSTATLDIYDLLKYQSTRRFKYRYRKRQPKAQSHDERCSLWWKDDYGRWQQCLSYLNGNYRFYDMGYGHDGCNNYVYIDRSADWFIGRQSATIPPEEKS